MSDSGVRSCLQTKRWWNSIGGMPKLCKVRFARQYQALRVNSGRWSVILQTRRSRSVGPAEGKPIMLHQVFALLTLLRSFELVFIPNIIMSSSTRSQSRDSASASTRHTTTTSRTRSTGVFNGNFQQHYVDHGIYPTGYRYADGSLPTKPANWPDINNILRQPRPSLSI